MHLKMHYTKVKNNGTNMTPVFVMLAPATQEIQEMGHEECVPLGIGVKFYGDI